MKLYVIVLAYFWRQSTKFQTVGYAWWFFTSFYLQSYIWPDMILRHIRQKNSKCASHFVKPSCPGLSLVTRAEFVVMTLRQSNKPYNRKVQTHWLQKRRDGLRARSRRACSLITKNLSWQAKQPIPHTTMVFYGNCVKNMRWLCLRLWQQLNWLLHHNKPFHTYFFTREFSTKTIWQSFHTNPILLTWPPLTFLSFWHNWGDRDRIKAVQNTVTEHHFQGTFKNDRSTGHGAYARMGTALMVASMPKLVFDQMAHQSRKLWMDVVCEE
jgi:hypothetical protein